MHDPQSLRLTGKMVHHFTASGHLGLGLGEGLTFLAVNELRDLRLVTIEHRGVCADVGGATQRCQCLPRRERSTGGGHCRLDILGSSGGHLTYHRARRAIGDG